MGDVQWTVSTEMSQRRREEFLIIMVYRRLSIVSTLSPFPAKMILLDLIEVLLARVPVPVLSTVLLPVVDCRLAAADPGVVVCAAATAEDLTAGVGLLKASIFGAVDQGGLVGPVVLAVAQLEGAGRSADHGDVVGLLEVCESHLEYLRERRTYPTPASMTRTVTLGFSVRRPATRCLLFHLQEG